LKTEEGWTMYIDIRHLKQKGFSNTKIAAMLGISRPTVVKYMKMNAEQFEKELQSQRKRTKKLDIHEQEILAWLKQYPSMTAAQVYDWIEEKYKDVHFGESTLRSYVRIMRKEHNISRELNSRQYEALEDPPMGKQMQVDFGEKNVIQSAGKEIKIYVMCFVLSHSRQKYCEWQVRPFCTADIIQIHENAFVFYGGYPEEAVYDQDHLILVSENHGELIYTKEFAAYLQKRRFRIHMCRKADPESKGRVEKVVDFVKGNFANHRTFYTIDKWNEDCLKWLTRRANGKTHTITKKVPAEVFAEEQKHLQPVTEKIISNSREVSITYQVKKDNTVPIQGNRYTVPCGTYQGPDTYVRIINTQDRHVVIYDLESENELARHKIPDTKGNLCINNDHKRDKSKQVYRMMADLVAQFTDEARAKIFLEGIYREKPRYTRDQLQLIESAMQDQDQETVDKALDYCIKHHLFSAIGFRDAVRHYSRKPKCMDKTETVPVLTGLTEAASEKMAVKAQIRDISEYIKIINKKSGG